MAFTLLSTAFTEGNSIPKKYSCDGENSSPPLSWSGLPAGTKSLALIMDDPDAPSGTFVHWVLYAMPAALVSLPESVAKTPSVAGIGVQGSNSARKAGYTGPCPPSGTHRYFFKLFALDTQPKLSEGATAADLEKAMGEHILGKAQLMGRFQRGG